MKWPPPTFPAWSYEAVQAYIVTVGANSREFNRITPPTCMISGLGYKSCRWSWILLSSFFLKWCFRSSCFGEKQWIARDDMFMCTQWTWLLWTAARVMQPDAHSHLIVTKTTKINYKQRLNCREKNKHAGKSGDFAGFALIAPVCCIRPRRAQLAGIRCQRPWPEAAWSVAWGRPNSPVVLAGCASVACPCTRHSFPPLQVRVAPTLCCRTFPVGNFFCISAVIVLFLLFQVSVQWRTALPVTDWPGPSSVQQRKVRIRNVMWILSLDCVIS